MKFLIDLMTHGVDYERFRRVYFSEPFNLELVSAIDLLLRRGHAVRSRETDARYRIVERTLQDYIDKRRDVPA